MPYVGFNEEYQVLVDEQGIMLSEADAVDLLDKLTSHFEHRPLELAAIGRRMLEKSHPTMVNQFNFDWFEYSEEYTNNE